MIYIEKGKEPSFLTEFKRKFPKKTYDDNEFAIHRKELTDFMIKEQKGLCAYCCCLIKQGKAHNEHIEPRHPDRYESKRSLDYMNLVASCNNKKTCGNKKGNDYKEEQFISPLDFKCESIFTYYGDGEIAGDAYTIDLLNLNDYELREARRAVYQQLQSMDKETIELVFMNQQNDQYPQFYDVIKWYVKNM